MDDARLTIALVGAHPPPFGGVGVHLQRLAKFLDRSGVPYRWYNTISGYAAPPRVVSIARFRSLRFVWFCLTHRHRLVHLQTTHWGSQLVFGIAAWLRSGIYMATLHNMQTHEALIGRSGRIRRWLTRWWLRRLDAIIAVNEPVAESCIQHAGVRPERIRVLPAYLPADPADAPPLPPELSDFVASHQPVLTAFGWFGRRFDGVDLYGLDLLTTLAVRLRTAHPKLGIVYVSLGGDETAEREARARVCAAAGGSIMIPAQAMEDASALLLASDAFLRPTNTDGDSNSVREALALNIPVVASDAVPRPEGCRLFRSRDIDDFTEAVRRVLADETSATRSTAADHGDNPATAILAWYDELLGSATLRSVRAGVH